MATRWVFAPHGSHPSRFWRLAPWRFFSLGCRGVNETPTLDTPGAYQIKVDPPTVRKSYGYFMAWTLKDDGEKASRLFEVW
jgi:hypothetical protein